MSFNKYTIQTDISLKNFKYILEHGTNDMSKLTMMKDMFIDTIRQGYRTGEYTLAIAMFKLATTYHTDNETLLGVHIQKNLREFSNRTGMFPQNFGSFEEGIGKKFERPRSILPQRVSAMTLDSNM